MKTALGNIKLFIFCAMDVWKLQCLEKKSSERGAGHQSTFLHSFISSWSFATYNALAPEQIIYPGYSHLYFLIGIYSYIYKIVH